MPFNAQDVHVWRILQVDHNGCNAVSSMHRILSWFWSGSITIFGSRKHPNIYSAKYCWNFYRYWTLNKKVCVSYHTNYGYWNNGMASCKTYLTSYRWCPAKESYTPCLRMADRALLAGYPRYDMHSALRNTYYVGHIHHQWKERGLRPWGLEMQWTHVSKKKNPTAFRE